MVFKRIKLKRYGRPYREEDKEIIIECECGNCAVIKLGVWNWERSNEQDFFLSIYHKHGHKKHVDLVLTPEKIQEIIKFYGENLKEE